jgi:hypothetical protein
MEGNVFKILQLLLFKFVLVGFGFKTKFGFLFNFLRINSMILFERRFDEKIALVK